MRLGVVVPTFKRAESLRRCLVGIQNQTRAADEVLVVLRDTDDETTRMLESWINWPALRVITEDGRGAVSQYNAGVDASRGDVIAFTDDDAVPRPDWLMRIEKHFLINADVGGVGGRDFVVENGVFLDGHEELVGTVQWFGRVVGSHHIGARFLPNVDILKGVNMAFRTAAISEVRFPRDLRGSGAQTSLEMAFCFDVQRNGWRLLFDPKIAVDHYPARRFDANQRQRPSMEAIEDSSFNFLLSLYRHMKPGWRRRMALLWSWSVGTERNPGVIRGLRSFVRRDAEGLAMHAAAKRARKSVKLIST